MCEQFFDGRVELLGQFLVVFAKGDHVEPRGQRLADKLELRLEIGVALGVLQGDRQIEEHRIELVLRQVFIGRGLVVVGANRDALLVEQPGCGRIGHRAHNHALLLAVVQRLEAVVVAAADQLQRVDVVGPRKAESLLAVGRGFHAVHGEIKIAAEQPGIELGKRILLELDRPADFPLQGVAKIDFETDILAGMFRVHRNIGRPALGVGRPEQRLLSRRRVGRLCQIPPEKCQQNQPACQSHANAMLHAEWSPPSQRRPESPAKKRKNWNQLP